MVGPLTVVLIGLLASFGVADLVAYLTKGRYGESFSDWDQGLEKQYVWLKALNFAVLVVLIAHLVFSLF